MTESQDGQHPQPLPEELAAALRRATAGTFGAFQSLRTALRDHVHNERARGVTLREIDADLKSMIEVAGVNIADGDGDHLGQHIDELKAHVLRWSEAFYSRKT